MILYLLIFIFVEITVFSVVVVVFLFSFCLLTGLVFCLCFIYIQMQFLCTFQSFGNKSRFVHVTESEAERVRAGIVSTLFRKLCSFEKICLKHIAIALHHQSF